MAVLAAHVVGYGSTVGKNVFKVTFSRPLSSKVKYECYDNDQTFPAVDTVLTTDNKVFGIWPTSVSRIGLQDTTATGAAGTNWYPTATNPVTSSLNLMDGADWYVTQHGATVVAGGSITWNMQISVPATAKTVNYPMGFDVLLRYSFTSTTPTLNWYFNDSEAGGTNTVPVWAFATPGSYGIRHCRSGTATSGPYLANIPVSGAEKTLEGLVTD